MNYPKLNVLKYKIIIPLLVFLIGTEVLCAVVYKISYTNQEQVRDKAALNAVSYADRMITDLDKGITITKSLEQIIISENGQIEHFEKVAENMIFDSIQSIQLAPGGVVTDIYPEKGNEAGKIDLINDPSRGEITRYGRDNNITIMQGPFQLKQGDVGIAIRNPVYLENESGDDISGDLLYQLSVCRKSFQIQYMHLKISDIITACQKLYHLLPVNSQKFTAIVKNL